MKYTLRDIKQKFQPFILYTPELFSYSLVVCLVLFLLENVFPGFVSDTFKPILLIVPIVALGIASAFAPEKTKKYGSTTLEDLLAVGVMTILSGIVIYYKTQRLGAVALAISIAGAFLVLFVAVTLLFASEENIKTSALNIFSFAKLKHAVKNPTKRTWFDGRRIALVGVFLVELAIVFFVIKYPQVTQKEPVSQPIPTNNEIRLTLAPTEEKRLTEPAKNILDQTPLTLINGGLGDKNTIELAKELTTYGITIQTTGEANTQDYTGGTLYFRSEDEAVADFLTSILQPTYPSMIKMPLPSTVTGIVFVAGKPGGTQ